MWRRFSNSSTESTSPSNQQQPPPPPPPSTPVSATPKSATSAAQHQPLTKPQTNPSTKEHELANQRPAGAGQRRRSSLLEKWTRESTKEGMCVCLGAS